MFRSWTSRATYASMTAVLMALAPAASIAAAMPRAELMPRAMAVTQDDEFLYDWELSVPDAYTIWGVAYDMSSPGVVFTQQVQPNGSVALSMVNVQSGQSTPAGTANLIAAFEMELGGVDQSINEAAVQSGFSSFSHTHSLMSVATEVVTSSGSHYVTGLVLDFSMDGVVSGSSGHHDGSLFFPVARFPTKQEAVDMAQAATGLGKGGSVGGGTSAGTGTGNGGKPDPDCIAICEKNRTKDLADCAKDLDSCYKQSLLLLAACTGGGIIGIWFSPCLPCVAAIYGFCFARFIYKLVQCDKADARCKERAERTYRGCMAGCGVIIAEQ